MKKVIVFAVILCFAFSAMFIGCGKKEEPKPAPVVKATPKPVVATPAPTPVVNTAPDKDSKAAGLSTKEGTKVKKATGLKKK